MEMDKKQAQNILQFPPLMYWIYWWVELEVLGNPVLVTFDFLSSLREENLLTLEGEYEEDYTLEVPSANERVCYINQRNGLN